MPKYAYFDSTKPSPQSVIGWYDTDEFNYLSLPIPADLLELTTQQWDNRFSTPLVNNGTLISVPAPTSAQLLEEAKTIQLALMDSAYLSAMQQPVAYMGTTFQADANSQSLMNHAITALQSIVDTGGTVPANFAWYDINNVAVPMTLLQLQGLFATVAANVNTLFVHKQTQKAAIRAATTVADVQAIVF